MKSSIARAAVPWLLLLLPGAPGVVVVGVPGAVAMLALAHRQHGKLPWPRLCEPAIALS